MTKFKKKIFCKFVMHALIILCVQYSSVLLL